MTFPQERIEGVAFRLTDGTIHSLPSPNRHHDVIRHMVSLGVSLDDRCSAEQGFITNTRFLHRHAAVRVAEEAGQIIKRTAPTHGLFSEDLW